MTHRPRNAARRRGSAMVESSLSIMLFLLLTFGIIEGGVMLWTYNTLCHATREGARFAVIHGEGNPVQNDVIIAVTRQNAIGLNPQHVTVTTTWDPDNSRGSEVEVRASYLHRFLVGSLVFPGQAINLSSTSRMTVYN